MKIFIRLSWRNIWRHRRRSMVVVSSIAIGVFVMIFSAGFMGGMNQQMVENTISTSLGHVAIHKKGFQDNLKLKYNFVQDAALTSAIEETPHLKAYAPRVKMQAMIRSSEASRSIMLVGIDPEQEMKVSKLFDYTIKEEGSRYLISPDDEGILISRSMAQKLDMLIGDRLVVMLQDRSKEIVGTGFRVTGFYESPVDGFDKYMVFVGINKLKEMTGLGNSISEITILTDDKNSVDAAKDFLVRHVDTDQLEVLSWKDMAPSLVRSIKLFDTMMFIFFAIIFITVVFSIANILIMAIMERFHEIGVMKSIGTRPLQIFSLIIFEAIGFGILGAGLGIGAGILINVILSYTGINLSFYMESMRMWGTGSVIYPQTHPFDIVISIIIVFVTTIIAALYPAVKAARIKPLDALHFI